MWFQKPLSKTKEIRSYKYTTPSIIYHSDFTLFTYQLSKTVKESEKEKKNMGGDPLTFLHDVEIALSRVHFVQAARVARLLQMRASKLESQSRLGKYKKRPTTPV